MQPPTRECTMGRTVELMDRITVNPDQCAGRPCVRGMRIRVVDVLDPLAVGLAPEQVVEELADLELADVAACLRFASRRLNHPVLVAYSRQRYRSRWSRSAGAPPNESRDARSSEGPAPPTRAGPSPHSERLPGRQ